MAENYNILQENEKRYPRFNGFGEMLFWVVRKPSDAVRCHQHGEDEVRPFVLYGSCQGFQGLQGGAVEYPRPV